MLRMKFLMSQTKILENLTNIMDNKNYRISGFRNKVGELEHSVSDIHTRGNKQLIDRHYENQIMEIMGNRK